jgi:hypothetical protein
LVARPNLIPDDETARLVALLERHLRAIIRAADAHAAELLHAEPQPDDYYRLRAIVQQVAQRARMMTEETRRAVRDTIAEGMARGYHPSRIARGVPDEGFRGLRSVVEETYRNRANAIARTETALVWQATAHDRYGQAGIRLVRIHDGAGCGWTSHRDPDKANGSIRTLADAMAHPISHPHCRRASAPVIERSLV